MASGDDRALRLAARVLRERDDAGGRRRRRPKPLRLRLAPQRGDQIARAKENGTTDDRRPVTVAGFLRVRAYE